MRRFILLGGVAKAQKYLDMPTLQRLARMVPKHLKMQAYFCVDP